MLPSTGSYLGQGPMRYLKISICVLVAASIEAACTHTQLERSAVAQTNRPATIVGDIEWNQAVWNLLHDSAGNPDPDKVDAQFTITACEQAPAPPGQFFTTCRTIGTGHITSVKAKTLSAGASGNASTSTVFAARYQIPVAEVSSSGSVSVSVKRGAAFEPASDKNSLIYAIPTDRSTMPLSGGGNVVLNWNVVIVPNVCDD